MSFVHLHTHSHYSLLDGLGKIPGLVEKAKAEGMPALALTDHGVLYGAIEFYKTCKAAGIKPIIGTEAYVAPHRLTDKTTKSDARYHHLILLAKNEAGYKNLIELTTKAHLEGFYYRPRTDKYELETHSEGLIALTACLGGELPGLIAANQHQKAKEFIKWAIKTFGKENFYLEIQDNPELKEQNQANKEILNLAKEFGLGVVATNDIHYVNLEDKDAHEVLLAVQTGKDVDDEKRLTLKEIDLSFRTTEQMKKAFKDVPEAIQNTLKVAEKCNLEIPLGQIHLPIFPTPDGKKPEEYLKELCEKGIKDRYEKETSEIRTRLEYELKTINKMGFASYFLIVQDFVNFAKKEGIQVGPGRGSAAGSIVSYLLNITDLDPLKYGLLFERFLNPDRISMPDIDLDFADDRRGEVLEYVRKKYGEERVAGIITFGTMAARAAVRDTGRAIGMSYAEVDRIAKLIPPPVQGRHTPLKDSIKNTFELNQIYEKEPAAKRLLDLAVRLEGTVRHASQHASAIIISQKPLTEYVPLQPAQQGDVAHITQYSMYPVEELGLLKIDFLGLANLTIIQNTLEIIEAMEEKKIDIHQIPLDDPKTFKLFSKGETTGVFQLESAGMKRYIKELKPTAIEDIIALVSLYRPGPIQWISSYIERKHGREKVAYLHPKAEAALKETFGIPIYQEQVMQIARDLAGFTGAQADTLRKAMGKKIKRLMSELKIKFVEGAVKGGIPQKEAEAIFTKLEDFSAYGFNKSHAASYALIAYQTAYLKAHFPQAFMAALLTSDFKNIDRIGIEIEEAERRGIKVLPPNVNESFVNFGVVKETGNIRFGLAAIKNVGVGVAEGIYHERKKNGPYKSLPDFLRRLAGPNINKKVMEALAKSGALDSLGERNQILAGMEVVLKYAQNQTKNHKANQTDLFGTGGQKIEEKFDLPLVEPAAKKQRLSWEKELLGIYLSEHPLKDIAPLLQKEGQQKINEVDEKSSGKSVKLAGIITKVQKINTRNGQSMIFAELEDLTGRLKLLVFPKLLLQYPTLFHPDAVLRVSGKLNTKENELKLLVDEAEEIETESVVRNSKVDIRDEQRIPNNVTDNEFRTAGREATTNFVIALPRHAPKTLLNALKEVLLRFPGESVVILKIPQNGQVEEVKTRTKVRACRELEEEVRSVVNG